MAKINKALKKLLGKCTHEGSTPKGNSTGAILDCIAEHWDASNVFIAEYNKTTLEEACAALKGGKMVFMSMTGGVHHLPDIDTDTFKVVPLQNANVDNLDITNSFCSFVTMTYGGAPKVYEYRLSKNGWSTQESGKIVCFGDGSGVDGSIPEVTADDVDKVLTVKQAWTTQHKSTILEWRDISTDEITNSSND